MGKTNANPSDYIDEFNSLSFVVNSIISDRVKTAELVRVITNNGDGTLDVLPIISDVDSEGNAISETPIFGVKFIEWQYGINAIQAQPAIGDVGLLVVCTKDTKNAQSGVVGDLGSFELESGIYLGGLKGFNQAPTQYIKFTENGIEITTPKTLTVNTTENVVVNATGNANVTAVDIVATASGKANIVAPVINLGGEGGKKIALDGDPVKSGNTVVGNVVASSATTNSL